LIGSGFFVCFTLRFARRFAFLIATFNFKPALLHVRALLCVEAFFLAGSPPSFLCRRSDGRLAFLLLFPRRIATLASLSNLRQPRVGLTRVPRI
jgi:hypothetical protein